jgi:hypothetical protein
MNKVEFEGKTHIADVVPLDRTDETAESQGWHFDLPCHNVNLDGDVYLTEEK